MKHVAILGGGIAGLSAAHTLALSGRVKVHLIEKSGRCGGWIRTLRDKSLFESGYIPSLLINHSDHEHFDLSAMRGQLH
jgi:protoporphyrinogen oxidase